MDPEALEALRTMAREAMIQGAMRIHMEQTSGNPAPMAPQDALCNLARESLWRACLETSAASQARPENNSATSAAAGSSAAAAAAASIDHYSAAAAAVGEEEERQDRSRQQMRDIFLDAIADGSIYSAIRGLRFGNGQNNAGGAGEDQPISQDAPPVLGDFGVGGTTGDPSVVSTSAAAAAAAAFEGSDGVSASGSELTMEEQEARTSLLPYPASFAGQLTATLDAVMSTQLTAEASAPEVASAAEEEAIDSASAEEPRHLIQRLASRETLLQASMDGRLFEALQAVRSSAMEEAARNNAEGQRLAALAVEEARRGAQQLLTGVVELALAAACTICLECLEPAQDIGVLPCSHVFHCACVEQWLRGRRTCPNCRTEVEVAGAAVA